MGFREFFGLDSSLGDKITKGLKKHKKKKLKKKKSVKKDRRGVKTISSKLGF